MVTYEFYVCKYKGSSISESAWDALERDASAKLNQLKRKYTVTAPEETSEAMAVCAMAEALDYFLSAQNGAGAAQSTSIGSVSVSYGYGSVDVSPKAQEKELYRSACMHLEICRGVM